MNVLEILIFLSPRVGNPYDGLLASGFLLLAEPETSSQEPVTSSQRQGASS